MRGCRKFVSAGYQNRVSSQDDTSSVVASFVPVESDMILISPIGTVTVILAGPSPFWLFDDTLLLSLSAQKSDNIIKGFLHVDAVLGRGFNKVATEFAGQSHSLL